MNKLILVGLIALVTVLLIVIIYLAVKKYKATPATPATPAKKSLYQRLGGVFRISLIIEDFSNALIRDNTVGRNTKNPHLREWYAKQMPSRHSGLKFLRTLWLCAVSGGPYVYSATRPGKCPFSLEAAHSKLSISSAEFDAAAAVLSKTLDKYKVPAAEKNEVLAAFAAHKVDVIGGTVKC